MQRQPRCELTPGKIKYLSRDDAARGITRMDEMAQRLRGMEQAEFVTYECLHQGGCGYWHVANKTSRHTAGEMGQPDEGRTENVTRSNDHRRRRRVPGQQARRRREH